MCAPVRCHRNTTSRAQRVREVRERAARGAEEAGGVESWRKVDVDFRSVEGTEPRAEI